MTNEVPHLFTHDLTRAPSRQLLLFVDPVFSTFPSRGQLLRRCQEITGNASDVMKREWHATVLIPMNYGPWPQAEIQHSLPDDLLVTGPKSLDEIHADFSDAKVGMGVLIMPLNCSEIDPDSGPFSGWEWDDPRAPGVRIPEMCAGWAAKADFAAFRFGPRREWLPGNNPFAINMFWKRFWRSLAPEDLERLKGNTCITMIPTSWGIDAFFGSIGPLAGGGAHSNDGQSLNNEAGSITAIGLECPGGPQTKELYPPPDLWPIPVFNTAPATGAFTGVQFGGSGPNLFPIIHVDNLVDQLPYADRLGNGVVGVMGV